MVRHWVVIETGANQAYIFGSNKQRINVGASAMVAEVGALWASQAAHRHGGAEVVVATSGKALILVDTPRTGRDIVSDVTRRALRYTPGLEVWGVVDPEPIRSNDDVGAALGRAHRLHTNWRSRKPSPLLRNPGLPFTQPCRETGLPANVVRAEGGDRIPLAFDVDVAWSHSSDKSRKAMIALDPTAVPTEAELDDELSNTGWTAVVHADGNGVGTIFTELSGHFTGEAFLAALQGFSQALETVTRESLQAAIRAVSAERAAGRAGSDKWVLPLVLGGDDVTVVCDGAAAVALVTEFCGEFMRRSAAAPDISSVTERILGRSGLTAAAGIAITKPKHPFSDAYELAEQLCESAKAVKDWDPGCSSLDFHVLHDSQSAGLDQLRRHLIHRGVPGEAARTWRQFSGPQVLPPDGHTVRDPQAGARVITELTAAVQSLRRPGAAISGKAAHDLRAALVAGPQEAQRIRDRIVQMAADPAKARSFLDRHLNIDPVTGTADAVAPAVFSRVIDAMDLADVAGGTAARRPAAATRPADAPGQPAAGPVLGPPTAGGLPWL